jgi:hypothetical protein
VAEAAAFCFNAQGTVPEGEPNDAMMGVVPMVGKGAPPVVTVKVDPGVAVPMPTLPPLSKTAELTIVAAAENFER